MLKRLLFLLPPLLLASCLTPPPSVEASREALWQQFGHQPIDTLLLAWGPPAAETKLTNGSRMVTYRHATTYDADSPYERTTACQVTFLAKAPSFRLDDIAMQGSGFDCQVLARGQIGYLRQPYFPPPRPYLHRYPYW